MKKNKAETNECEQVCINEQLAVALCYAQSTSSYNLLKFVYLKP